MVIKKVKYSQNSPITTHYILRRFGACITYSRSSFQNIMSSKSSITKLSLWPQFWYPLRITDRQLRIYFLFELQRIKHFKSIFLFPHSKSSSLIKFPKHYWAYTHRQEPFNLLRARSYRNSSQKKLMKNLPKAPTC